MRPDTATALLLINKNADNVMGQHFISAKNIAAKKLVGGIFHYCFIDQVDIAHCEDTSTPEDKVKFPGLNQVATIPPAVANNAVKDLIAGPFNTCAIMMDDSLQCFGRENLQHDLTKLNGGIFRNVIVQQNAVIAIDQADKVRSSPKQAGFKGLSLDPTKIMWGVTDEELYWTTLVIFLTNPWLSLIRMANS